MPDNTGDVQDAREPYGYPDMRTTQRNAVTLTGNPAGQPMVFAHGFGCDQNMWRLVAPAFADDAPDRPLRSRRRRQVRPVRLRPTIVTRTLDGYADDVLEICTSSTCGTWSSSGTRSAP